MTETDPSPASPFPQSALENTRSNLRLLGVFYILLGVFSLPALLVLALHGPILDQLAQSAPDPETIELIRRIINVSIVGFAVLILVHVAACFYIGACFRKQKHHTLCLIAAVFCCLSFPLGTILGVFSLVVLMKEEAKFLFGVPSQSI